MACSFHFVALLLLIFFLFSSTSAALATSGHSSGNATATTTLRPGRELLKQRRIRALLGKLNKPSVKTIKSPDGDFIDCVPSHLQPAFDHPKLSGQKPMDPPERPKNYNTTTAGGSKAGAVVVQAWHATGEACPEGTVALRRTTEKDLLRASSLRRYGRKPARRSARRDSTGSGHEHAVGYVNSEKYYGARASVNVWSPRIGDPSEFSLSQIWVISGSFSNDLNTIEAGWQTDAYQETGCYNHNCPGFVQTTNKIAIGAAITPESVYNGRQFDLTLMIWKDPKHGHWWLEVGPGVVVGYWPSGLFTHLSRHARMVQFGGEIFNARPTGSHTATEMGSGHFAGEGFDRAAYFRNLQVVDWDNSIIRASNLKLLADHPECYNIQGGFNNHWGTYFYYGGPGRNVKCP
ncbi:unnamed protein product [Alopecurus aequalis]